MAKKKETVIKPKTLGEQEASKEKINRAFKTDERLNAIADSISYDLYMKEYKNYYGWQNSEPMDTEPDVRYEFDKENYLKGFHGKYLSPLEDFKESIFINIILPKLINVTHTSHVEYREFLQAKLKLLSNEKNNAINSKKPTTVDIAIFCRIIDDAKIERIGNKTQENYCKKICEDYSLNYTNRVRVNFTQNISPTKKQLSKVIESIIPLLNEELKTKINEYINNKTKMYA